MRHAYQRRVHEYVAFVARKRPVDDLPLHRFRYATVPFFDPLERYVLGHDPGRNVQQRIGRPGLSRSAGRRRAVRESTVPAAQPLGDRAAIAARPFARRHPYDEDDDDDAKILLRRCRATAVLVVVVVDDFVVVVVVVVVAGNDNDGGRLTADTHHTDARSTRWSRRERAAAVTRVNDTSADGKPKKIRRNHKQRRSIVKTNERRIMKTSGAKQKKKKNSKLPTRVQHRSHTATTTTTNKINNIIILFTHIHARTRRTYTRTRYDEQAAPVSR